MAIRVLVADSDVPALELATAVLTRNGFEVDATNDGGDALARFLETSPDVVICDADLPGLRGPQLCRQVRAQSDSVWILLYVGVDDEVGEDRAKEVCCNAILRRPFRFGSFREHLVEWGVVEDESREERRDEMQFGVPAPPVSIPTLDAPSFEAEALEAEALEPEPLDAVDASTSGPIPIPLPLEEEQQELSLDDAVVGVVVGETPPEGKTSLPPSVPRFGDLASLPLPRLIFELYLGSYSGILRLSRQELRRTIYFWGGLPVRVDSDFLFGESLGALLLEAGAITQEQHDQGQRIMLERGTLMGEALMEIGAIREQELLQALRDQTELKVVNSFAWRDGKFAIEDDTSFAAGSLLSEVAPLKAIWRGVHEQYDLTALIKFFGRLRERYVVATELFAVQSDQLGSFLRSLDVAKLLDGKRTFEQALRSDDSRSVEIAQALYVLLVTDMIKPSEQPGEAAPVVAAPKVEHKAAPVDYRLMMEASDRIAREYLRIKGKSADEVLNVAPGASAEKVTAAYRRMVDELRRDADVPGLANDAKKHAREILDIFATARDQLKDPSRLEAAVQESEDTDAPTTLVERRRVKRRSRLVEAEQAYKEGTLLLEILDPRGAHVQFEKALAANGSEPTYHVALAQTVMMLHKKDPKRARSEAFAHLQQALRLDPGNILANLQVAELCMRGNLFDQARRYVERILQKAPHHQKARKLLEDIEAVTKK